jgi:hypothetical protein
MEQFCRGLSDKIIDMLLNLAKSTMLDEIIKFVVDCDKCLFDEVMSDDRKNGHRFQHISHNKFQLQPCQLIVLYLWRLYHLDDVVLYGIVVACVLIVTQCSCNAREYRNG